MATLWLLDDYSRQHLTRAPQTISRTSKPQAWGIPNQKRKVIHEPVMETQVLHPKHPSEVTTKRRQGVSSTLFDPRSSKMRCLDVAGLLVMKRKLEDRQNNKIPCSIGIPDSSNEFQIRHTILGTVAVGSLLDVQLRGKSLNLHHSIQIYLLRVLSQHHHLRN